MSAEYQRRWRAKNPEKARRLVKEHQRRRRGQTQEPTRAEPELCELCNRSNQKSMALNEDHCKATGKFRGWLCHNCNVGLGFLGDNLKGLQRAVRYLERNNG